MKHPAFYLTIFLFLFGLSTLQPYPAQAAPLPRPVAQTVTGDMISPRNDLSQCLTVDGTDVTIAPNIILDTCRGTTQQLWTHNAGAGQWQTGLNSSYCLATVGSTPSAGGSLTVRLCTDSRAFSLEPNPTLTDSYRLVGTSFVLDWGVYGKVAVASQNGWDYQFFRWFQPDLDTVNAQGCAITYPFAATATATYNRELACDHVAKMQPPYVRPAAAQRDPSIFPGVVPAGASLVTGRTFTFNLQFQDNSYARMASAPHNWKSTGLYAPAEQIVNVTVSNATAADLSQVYVLLGVHTDVLQPTSLNVVSAGQFLRYPNVVTRIRLQPGLNQVRSPYGGLIILVSEASVSKTINVQIDNAVEAPYFVAGQTTEAQWLARRTAPAPWGEVESGLAVLSVASSQLSVLSYADVTAMAQFYSDITRYHNEVSGLTGADPVPNLFPQGQQRFVTDKQISLGSAHSGYPTMFFDSYLLGKPSDTILRSTDTDWGMFHEFGHNYQMGAWSNVYGTESTVNIFSLHAQELFFGNSRLADSNTYTSAIALLNNAAIPNKWAAADFFQKLVFIDQLRLGFPNLDWNFWQQVMRRYRAMTNAEYDALNTDQLKYDKFMTIACDVANSNLTPHFTAWTIPVSQTPKDYCATKPALTRQIWLIDNAKPLWYHPGSGSGGFLREYWSGISGSTLSSLTGNAAYPNSPTGSGLLTTGLEGAQNFADNYGERLRGYLHPPVTGAYRFWLSGDDTAQLRLSTDEDPIHAVNLLTLTTSTGYRGFDEQNLSVQRSVAVSLEAGKKYYIEVLHKEGTGSDSVSVAWNIPATAGAPGEVRKIIAAQYLSPYTGDLSLQKTLAPGQPPTVPPGSDVTFQMRVTNAGTAVAHNVQLMDTLPTSFTISPADANGWVTGYRYVRFEADSEVGASSGTTTVSELGLLDGANAQIAKTGWVATANSQETVNENTPASNAIDDNTTTFWGSQWNGGATPFPHTLTIDTGAPRTLTGFTYLPRQSSTNGRVGAYKFFVSIDGANWVQVATGAFDSTATQKTVTFTAPPSGRFFATLPGLIAPSAAVTLNIVLRAGAGLAGTYVNTAKILTALDASNTLVRDANAANDTATATVVVATVPPAKVNSQLTQVSFGVASSTTTPDVNYPAQSTKGVLVAALGLNNTGAAVKNVYYQVKTLTNGNYLLNANGGPGQVGSTLTVPNSALPAGNQLWDQNELLTQNFRIGLLSRNAFSFRVDVYATVATVVAAAESAPQLALEDSFIIEIDPDTMNTTVYRLYLPAALR
ncbi:MAG: M60 family metallopeptidase [Caldilineaceae bacterium]